MARMPYGTPKLKLANVVAWYFIFRFGDLFSSIEHYGNGDMLITNYLEIHYNMHIRHLPSSIV